jgi:hypothetical protein
VQEAAAPAATGISDQAFWGLVITAVAGLAAQVFTIVSRYLERRQRREWLERDREWQLNVTTKIDSLDRRVPASAIRCGDVAEITAQRRSSRNGQDRRHADTHVKLERRERADETPDESDYAS